MGRKFSELLLSAAILLLISSCATLSGNGVGRIRGYVVESERLPASFDGLKLAFLSDFHLYSKFTPERLQKVVVRLQEEYPDVLLFGGDYVSSPRHAALLFSSFSSVKTTHGTYAVLGNHDYLLRDTLEVVMRDAGVRLLADEAVVLSAGTDSMAIVGVCNSFSSSMAVCELADSLYNACYTLLLSHTPDFAQDTRARCDLVLSGHTHGGQVSLFGLYTPVTNSKYGSRFLRGRNYTDDGVPVITTNGVGTSRRKLRFCVPSEIVIITLRRIPGDN